MAGRRDGRGRAIGYINVDIRWEPRSPKLRQPRSPVDHRAPEPNPYLPVLLVQEDALAHLARPQTTDFSESLSAVIILTDTKGPPPPPPPTPPPPPPPPPPQNAYQPRRRRRARDPARGDGAVLPQGARAAGLRRDGATGAGRRRPGRQGRRRPVALGPAVGRHELEDPPRVRRRE